MNKFGSLLTISVVGLTALSMICNTTVKILAPKCTCPDKLYYNTRDRK